MGSVPLSQHCLMQREQSGQFPQWLDQIGRNIRQFKSAQSWNELCEEVDVGCPIADLLERIGPITSKFDLDGDAYRFAGSRIEHRFDEGAVVNELSAAVHTNRLGMMEATYQYSTEAMC